MRHIFPLFTHIYSRPRPTVNVCEKWEYVPHISSLLRRRAPTLAM